MNRVAVRSVALVLAVAAAGAGAAGLLRARLPAGEAAGLALGAGLAAAGALSWIAAASWARERGAQAFMAVMALGILGRLVVYGATLIYVTLRTRVDPLWTAGSLMGFYVLFMMVEIRFALRGLKR